MKNNISKKISDKVWDKVCNHQSWFKVGGKVLDQVEQVIEFQIVNQVKLEIKDER